MYYRMDIINAFSSHNSREMPAFYYIGGIEIPGIDGHNENNHQLYRCEIFFHIETGRRTVLNDKHGRITAIKNN
jgi:hypothetical protein